MNVLTVSVNVLPTIFARRSWVREYFFDGPLFFFVGFVGRRKLFHALALCVGTFG